MVWRTSSHHCTVWRISSHRCRLLKGNSPSPGCGVTPATRGSSSSANHAVRCVTKWVMMREWKDARSGSAYLDGDAKFLRFCIIIIGMFRARDDAGWMPCFAHGSPTISSSRNEKRLNTTFLNRTGKTVEMWWFSFEGKPIYYSTCANGSKALFHTFKQHPWFFRFAPSLSPEEALDSRFIMVEENNKQVAFPSKKYPTQTLTLAKPAPWSLANHGEHCRADTVFAAGVREFLKAHNRLRSHPELQLQQDRLRPGPTTRSMWKLFQKGSPSMTDRASEGGACERSQTTTGQGSPRGSTNLGDLPYDLILDIINHWAPPIVPDVLPVVPSDMEDEEGEEHEAWGWDIQGGQEFLQPGLAWMAANGDLQIQMAQDAGGNEEADEVETGGTEVEDEAGIEGMEMEESAEESGDATQQDALDSNSEDAEVAWLDAAAQFGSQEEP
ncbi:hypothetical protein DUNSADRAFT_10086 [Dunaliella salina]|uniref:von Hippel-Lindau disease tumour suppressor beta domain-containing protein n=1 Tax=Dunaliella salina TaxID=3046 RepID=A0ABQ7GG25_DUNSA|nr:hypothetical protein DUNSADRAFT_10086 [Dunaliella salina]|eukprot:KAF5833554.1 hypothetical protein DUNSADRAFT_10086 [Dunaliella salina]